MEDIGGLVVEQFWLESVARSRQVCIYWLWKHCLFCRDCLWRERTSIYSWRLPWFAGNALYRLTGDAPSPRRRSPCASLAITLCLTGDHLMPHWRSPYASPAITLSMTPC